MPKRSQLVRINLRVAKATWTGVSRVRLSELKALTGKYSLCVASGDVQLLDEHWYVTHAGLLRLAERRIVLGLQSNKCRSFVSLRLAGGYSERLFTRIRLLRASWATVTQTLPTHPLLSAAPKCESPRRGLLIAPYARPTESDSVLSKS